MLQLNISFIKFLNGLSGKGPRIRLPIEDQLEIVRLFESGQKAAHIAKNLGLKYHS